MRSSNKDRGLFPPKVAEGRVTFRILDDTGLKKDLKVFWFATGKDDFLAKTSQPTVDMFRRRQFEVEYTERNGAHTWIVWREYFREFAPKLFR